MEIIKIIGIGILCCIAFLIVKETKPEFSLIIVIVGGIILIISVINDVKFIFTAFQNIIDKTGLSSNLFNCVLKIIGMGYLTEFGAGICNDAGCASLGEKIIFTGKVSILVVSLPIITNIVEILSEIIQ